MPSRRDRILSWLRGQVQAQDLRWRLWAPVALGGGCAAYFALKAEPASWPLFLAAAVTATAWITARRLGAARAVTLPLMLLACFAGGLALAKARSDAVAAPIAPALSGPTTIEGWVIDVDSPGAAGPRLLLAPVRIRGLGPEETPIRLRVTLRGAQTAPAPGAPVRLYAILNPPPAPASPGAYDFGRAAWFQGMGGVAFALTAPRSATLDPPPWRIRLVMRVNAVRYALAERIVDRLGPRIGGIAAAMVTGHESWLLEEDVSVMRDSGLAHILSISGLHMAVVGGFVFFLFRFLVAAWPWLALRAPGKKVAAWAGLIAVGVYLVISGAPPPAERAAVTAAIAFLAVLLDRPAITMHALAVAAFVVLLLQPEAVVMPGFQMSFAATAALVALAEAWPRRVREISVPWPIAVAQKAGAWLGIAVLASLVAGMATGPFAMQHFNRTAIYGLAANLATAPVADFLIMPMLALGAVLEPLGLGAPFLWLAGQGIAIMLWIGKSAADMPGAVHSVASAPMAALPVAFLGVLFLCLWRGRLRWLGLPFACAVMIWPRPPAPDLWIGDAATNAAYVEDGRAVAVRPRVRLYAVDQWSRRRGLDWTGRSVQGWTCRRTSCAPDADAASPADSPVALWWGRSSPNEAQLTALCEAAPVVAVRAVVASTPPACADRLVLDGADFARGGAVELWRDGAGWRGLWAADVRGLRPWSRFGDPEISGE